MNLLMVAWVPGKEVPCFQVTSLRIGRLVITLKSGCRDLLKLQENLLSIVEQGGRCRHLLLPHLSHCIPAKGQIKKENIFLALEINRNK